MTLVKDGAKLTKTQKRLLDLMQDGLPHSRPELHRLLYDELADKKTINVHLCHIRKKLKDDLQIICELYKRNLYYRLVRLVGYAKKLKGLKNAPQPLLA